MNTLAFVIAVFAFVVFLFGTFRARVVAEPARVATWISFTDLGLALFVAAYVVNLCAKSHTFHF